MKFRLSINSLNPRQTDFFGKRALLAPQTLKSYLLHKDSLLDIILNDFVYEETDESICSHILSQNVTFISFSTYVWNVERIVAICDKIKKKRKESLIVVGGPGVSYTADELLTEHSCIDVVVLGEGEEILYRLVQKVKANNFDFHDIPNLTYCCGTDIRKTRRADFLILEEQNYPLDPGAWQECNRVCYETSRGCVMKCKFCLWHKGNSGSVRFYPMEKVKSDLRNIFRLSRIKILEFVDADINMNRKRALEIFRYIRFLNDEREKRNMNRVFIMYETDPQMLSDEIIEEMSRHDKIIDFGLQTIDEELHRSMGRFFRRKRYFQNLEKLVTKHSDRVGEYMLEIIYGLPGDTLEGFKNTISFILSLPYIINFWSFRFLMLPGTIYHREAAQFGAVFNLRPPYELVRSDTWSEEDLNEARKLSFYFFLVQYGLPEVFEMVNARVPNNKLNVYEIIFEHFSKNYKELESLLCGIGEETYQFQVCKSFSSNPSYCDLRCCLLQDSSAIIKDFDLEDKA